MRVLFYSLFVLAIGVHQAGAQVRHRAATLPDVVEEIGPLEAVYKDGREVLHFPVTHRNRGTGPFRLRADSEIVPCPPAIWQDQCVRLKQELLDANGALLFARDGGFAWYDVFNHGWSLADVARYELRAGSLTGAVVAAATVSSCLIDYLKPAGARDAPTFVNCQDFQGLSAGWADTMVASTPTQSLSLDGVPDGVYVLVATFDPFAQRLQSDATNDETWVRFVLAARPAQPRITVLERSR